jgi:hypothetical protein
MSVKEFLELDRRKIGVVIVVSIFLLFYHFVLQKDII